MIVGHINLAPFDTTITLITNTNLGRVTYSLNKKHNIQLESTKDELAFYVNTFNEKESRTYHYICIKTNGKKIDRGVVLHECCHAIFSLLRSVGTTLTNSSEEIYAYNIEYLFNKTTKLLKKKGFILQ